MIRSGPFAYDGDGMSQGAATRARAMLPILLATALVIPAAVTSTVLAVLAEQNSPATAASTTERANQLVRAGHTEAAVQLLKASLAIRPADLDARLALADIYSRTGRNPEAEEEFRQSLRLHPESSSAELALGAFYISTGSLNAAEQVLGAAVVRHPKATAIRMQLALALAGEHQYKDAEANLRLIPPPADPNARVRYFRVAASIHSGLGDSHAAAHDMEEALRVTPADPQLQSLASVVEAEAGEWQACLRNIAPLFAKRPDPETGLLLLRAQLATHKDFKSTLQTLRALNLPDDRKLELSTRTAEILALAEEHASAVAELQEASNIADGRDATLLYNLAVEQYAAGQIDDAFSTLESLRAQNDSAEVEDLAGDVIDKRGDFASAVRCYQNAIALAPHEERYRLSLGAEFLQYRAYQPAASVFQQAAEVFPNSARVYVGLGTADYLLEKYDDSVAAFLRADELDDGSGRSIGYLGATQVDSAAGPIPAAVDAICSRADSHPTQSAAVTWCGAVLFRQAFLAGDQTAGLGAIRRLRTAAKLAPDEPMTNCTLGQALEWTEQFAEARHWLEACVRLRPNSAEDHYRLSRVYQALGLKQAAAEQARRITNADAPQDQQQAIAQKFAHEMLRQPKEPAQPK
jgi:tetratricopeptide (TPR) repeat protein